MWVQCDHTAHTYFIYWRPCSFVHFIFNQTTKKPFDNGCFSKSQWKKQMMMMIIKMKKKKMDNNRRIGEIKLFRDDLKRKMQEPNCVLVFSYLFTHSDDTITFRKEISYAEFEPMQLLFVHCTLTIQRHSFSFFQPFFIVLLRLLDPFLRMFPPWAARRIFEQVCGNSALLVTECIGTKQIKYHRVM